MVIYLKPMSNQSGVLTAFPQRFKKMQIAEVRAVQTPATLCRPTDRRTDATKRIHYSPHMIKKCVGDMKWTERRTGTVDKLNNARGII